TIMLAFTQRSFSGELEISNVCDLLETMLVSHIPHRLMATGQRYINYQKAKGDVDHLDITSSEKRNMVSQQFTSNFREEHKSFSSIFVSNIPWNASVQDLWDICNKWDVLVSNLRTAMMGGFHLFADVAKYSRTYNRLVENILEGGKPVLGHGQQITWTCRVNTVQSNVVSRNLWGVGLLTKYIRKRVDMLGDAWVWLEFDSMDIQVDKRQDFKDVKRRYFRVSRCLLTILFRLNDVLDRPGGGLAKLASWAPRFIKKLGGQSGEATCLRICDLVDSFEEGEILGEIRVLYMMGVLRIAWERIWNDDVVRILGVILRVIVGEVRAAVKPAVLLAHTFLAPTVPRLASSALAPCGDGCGDGSGMQWEWRRPIRDGVEHIQLIRLVNLLQNYTPSLKHDRWNYLLDPSNEFSVASMRSHIESVMLSSVHDPVAVEIWKMVSMWWDIAMSNQEAGGLGSGTKWTRTYIPREREEAEQRLIDDYFGDDETPPKYPKEKFMRRYRMSSTFFAKIVNGITSYDAQSLPEYFHFFRKRYDATSRAKIGPILKCTSAIRQMAYGTTPDAVDEYLQTAECCSLECLDKVPGANNDLNVLYGSLLFDDVLADTAPKAPFVVNGRIYKKCYYLANDIYPTWSMFVKTFSIAREEKTLKFKRVQESARKDIERAFGFHKVIGELYDNPHVLYK
ncbi:RNA-directed DNA polymerase, eukaryota, partial [Tanacetum coccineum]